MSAEVDTGFAFADRLHELVLTHGPEGFSRAQKDALADYLISSAVGWVMACNRSTTPSKHGGSDRISAKPTAPQGWLRETPK